MPALQQTRPLASTRSFKSNTSKISLLLNAKRTQRIIAILPKVVANPMRRIILARMMVANIAVSNQLIVATATINVLSIAMVMAEDVEEYKIVERTIVPMMAAMVVVMESNTAMVILLSGRSSQ